MSTVDLRGAGILVTRPALRADTLCRAIEAAGGRPIRFPALEIRDPADPEAARAMLRRAAGFDLVVFVSANAVEHGAAWLPEGLPSRIAAVGEATARALRAHGLDPSLVPRDRADSEGLLALPDLQDVAGWRVLIVRGEGGRRHLADTLTARGASVCHAEVYRRAVPALDPAPLIAHWGELVQAIVATSNDVLDNLLLILGPAAAPEAMATALVVVSERMAAHARERGFVHVFTAAGAGDDALLRALHGACTLTPQGPALVG